MNIKFDLKAKAKQLGKNIADITRETGLNRNTVTALYHGKIEGIKFETLSKLCQVYNFDITDLLSIEKEELKLYGYYKEIRQISPFLIWIWFIILTNPPKEIFGDNKSLEQSKVFLHKDDGVFFADVNMYTQISEFVLNKYRDKNEFKRLVNKIEELAEVLKNIYLEVQTPKLKKFSETEFIAYCRDIFKKIIEYSMYTNFMHTFDNTDVGKKEVSRICQAYKISDQDLITLTEPIYLLYNHDKFLAEMAMARKIKLKRLTSRELPAYLKYFLKNDPSALNYRANFNYYNYHYSGGEDFTEADLVAMLQNILDNYDKFSKKSQQLIKYTSNRQKNIRRVLKRLKLRENPLAFFQQMVEMREARKKNNQMTVCILEKILCKIVEVTKINHVYLRYLGIDEIDSVLKGFLTEDILKTRYEEGIMMYIENKMCKIVVSDEAQKMKKALEKEVYETKMPLYFTGFVFSQGFCRGLVVSPEHSIDEIKNNILIINDYTPDLAKKIILAGGVITTKLITNKKFIKLITLNYIPCVQAVKKISGNINFGEVIDLRANHGTVIKVKA